MCRFLVIVVICGCAASNGHKVKQGPNDPFWCIALSGDKLRPVDARNQCERTLAKCQETRKLAQQVGFQVSQCSGQNEAVCLRVRFPEKQLMTFCFADGVECTRVEDSLPDTAEIFACAIESAD